MRPAPSSSPANRLANRSTTRSSAAARKARLRQITLDSLEPRTLMAVLPPVTVQNQVDISNQTTGQESSPSISVNPLNALQAVAVWNRIGGDMGGNPLRPTQGRIEGAFTTNGGLSWQNFSPQGTFLFDPTTSNPVLPLTIGSDASVAFDRDNNFYVVHRQTSAATVGAILVTPFNFSGGTPVAGTRKVLYEWGTTNASTVQALMPSLAVDGGVRSFTDPDTNVTQANKFSGNVYVSWTAFDPSSTIQPASSIVMVGSSDRGANFTAPIRVSDGGLGNVASRLTVSQGSGASTPGQVTAVWNDFNSLSTASPPQDVIWSDSISAVLYHRITGQGGIIGDATDVQTPDVDIPRTTTYTTNVNINDPRVITFQDLNVEVSLIHPQISELRIRLIPPVGSGLSPITLLDNRTTAANGTKTSGATGADLGPPTSYGSIPGTIFDAQAFQSITGNAGGAASVGRFRPDNAAPAPPGEGAPGAFSNLTDINGLTTAQVNGTWTLEITDFRFSNGPVQGLVSWGLQFTSGFTPGNDRFVATTTVRGALAGPYATASAASPLGIAPAPAIASDNTLGSFSAHPGRIYVTYVDRFHPLLNGAAANNPADNTDIRLAFSDNGGLSWTVRSSVVNDDSSLDDGFSESFIGQTLITGRPQFQPEVAVDQTTGTLVLSFLDARNDAARARVATYVATSIDGGSTFGPQTFVNTAQSAFDEITRQTVVLGPIPDNARIETTIGFGAHQGLAVLDGRVYPAYSSNLNGGALTTNTLDIRVSPSRIAAGPRIVASSMGPVTSLTVMGSTFNNTFAPDGTQQVDGFTVTFDRPVDRRTFNAGDVTVIYRRPTDAASSPGTVISVGSVTPLDLSGPVGFQFLATTFLVRFTTPQSGVGTYSYSVGPQINDLVRSTKTTVTPGATVLTPSSADVPKVIPDLTTITSTLVVNNAPVGEVVADVNVTLSLQHTWDSDLQITLIAPDGTRVVLVSNRGGSGDNFLGTTFDDSAPTPIANGVAPFNGTFRPDTALSALVGLDPNGTWTLEVADQVGGDSGNLISWSLAIRTGVLLTSGSPGNLMDQNANATVGEVDGDVYATPRSLGATPLQAPYDTTTLPLIVPGPRIVNAAVPGVTDTTDNLVVDAAVSMIDVTFDRDMLVSSFTPADILRVMGPAGEIFGAFTVDPVVGGPAPAPVPTFARTFRIGFPTQKYSGTYSIVLGPNIVSSTGALMDANRNAGLDALRGTVDPTTGTTITVTSQSTLAVPITTGKTITSSIVVTDDFVIQDLDLRLNITFPNDPDLSAVLIAPDGTRIRLFTGVGTTGASSANFTDTVFDDQAVTPIQNGGPPFLGRFSPQEPLNVLVGQSSVGTSGIYTLEITNASLSQTGTLNSWALLIRKPLPGTGLGETVADRSTVDFRIFTTDPTNVVATSSWTPVGPAAIAQESSAGRISGLAVDPSDSSGNTVYVAGASGGVWKTTNFLTSSPLGPVYHPLTDFGPTFGVNIGSLAVFPRNNDPNQSIIFAATGEGTTGSQGVGFLRSTDGGATWTLLDSSTNVDASGAITPISSALRNHIFVGTTSFKIVVDPRPTITGRTIVYAALSGTNGGLWRSLDTGNTWQLMRAGQATDVVLDPNSGPIDSVSNPAGNLQIVYAAFRGEGVFISQNQGNVFGLMTGVVGKPLVRDGDATPTTSIPVAAPAGVPNGAKGLIILAKPDLIPANQPNAELQNRLYQGWLYAAVATPGGALDGLYMTKDFGQNWTRVLVPAAPGTANLPTNDNSQPEHPLNVQSVVVDPTNPNVVYLGGAANGGSILLRIDTTGIADPHAFYLDNDNPDGGLLRGNTTSPITLKNAPNPPGNPLGLPTPTGTPIINLLQDPANPFVRNSTVLVSNTAQFGNAGSDSLWTPFDRGVQPNPYIFSPLDPRSVPMNGVQRAISIRDPLTGLARLIFGTNHGLTTVVAAGSGSDILGSIGGVQVADTNAGNLQIVNGSRNGNLQITQFYYGAGQPSQLAADIAQISGFFYGGALQNGSPNSVPGILDNGNIRWTGPTVASGRGSSSGVVTDQTGTGTVYQYKEPGAGGGQTNFFQVNGVGRTFGLLQQNLPGPEPDPQWPLNSPVYPGGHAFGNFAVNPINGDQIIISSAAGRIFGTVNQGRFWLPIGEPSALDGTSAQALAYGAPDPTDPTGATNFFLYAGTVGGRIFVTFTGGGGAGNNWIDISAGLDGSNVQSIITNPTRGSREAYAITLQGVYHMVNSSAPGATWINVTGDLFSQRHNPFDSVALGTETQPRFLNAIQADWRYIIPDNFANLSGPTHPMLYASAQGGVYRSLDGGATWRLFPDMDLNVAAREGGYLPNVQVTDLDLSLGNINPTTGRPNVATGENLLLATTFGRGSFSIRLAPIVFPNTATDATILRLSPTNPPPGGSDSGSSASDRYTNVTTPVIEGLSEQSAFGNVVTITLFDASDPTIAPVPIPLVAGTDRTDGTGRFSVRIAPGYFRAFDPANPTAPNSDGPKRILVQATNGSGTKGNLAPLEFILDTTPPAAIVDGRSPAPGSPAPDLDPPLVDRPDLVASSDSGFSDSDNITNVTSGLTFTMALAAGEPSVTRVFLVRDSDTNIVDSQTGVAAPGRITLRDPGPVSEGTHFYYTYQVDLAGNKGPFSEKLAVRIDTTAPARPNSPILDPNLPAPNGSDSGNKGDNITNVNRPYLSGLAEPGGLVQIVDAAGNVLGPLSTTMPNVAGNGKYSVQTSNVLADGTYSLRVRELDLAGNISQVSLPIIVTIMSGPLATPTLFLVAADDTGIVGDNITSVTRPRLVGTGTPGLNVQLILDSSSVPFPGGVLPGGVITPLTGQTPVVVRPDGSFSLQFPNDLPRGIFVVRAQVSDVAGNVASSATLSLEIIPATGGGGGGGGGQTPGKPTLALLPDDDSGIKGDNTTVTRRPRFSGLATFSDGSVAAGVVVELSTTSGQLLSTTTTSSSGAFTLGLPSDLINGQVTLQARIRDVAGNPGPPSNPVTLKIVTVAGDADNDGKADLDSFSRLNSRFTFGNSASPNSTAAPFLTQAGDIPFQGDFDGDGKIDYGFYRYGTGQWFVRQSRAGNALIQFGSPSDDLPVPADFDGDGRTDFALWRQSTGVWTIFNSKNGTLSTPQFGVPTLDQPVPADYDGDGKADLVVYRQSTGQWLASLSSGAQSVPGTFAPPNSSMPVPNANWGIPNVSTPVPADYDGDGKVDLGVYLAGSGVWYIAQTGGGQRMINFGQPTTNDIPVSADYDGDGKADLALFRPTNATWLILGTSSVGKIVASGQVNDVPLVAPLQPYRFQPRSTTVVTRGAVVPGAGSNFSATESAPNLGGTAARFASATSPARARLKAEKARAKAQARADAKARLIAVRANRINQAFESMAAASSNPHDLAIARLGRINVKKRRTV